MKSERSLAGVSPPPGQVFQQRKSQYKAAESAVCVSAPRLQGSLCGWAEWTREKGGMAREATWGQAGLEASKGTLVLLKAMGARGGFWAKWHVPISILQDYTGCRVMNRLGEGSENLLPESKWEMVVALTKKVVVEGRAALILAVFWKQSQGRFLKN